MTFPAFNQLYGSEFVPDGGIAVSVAPWGEKSTSTTFGARRPGTFRLVYVLDSSDWATLRSNYTSNVAGTQTFTWQEDSTSWTVQWAGPPQAERRGNLYFVTAALRVVIDYGSLITEQDDASDYILLENGDQILTEGAS